MNRRDFFKLAAVFGVNMLASCDGKVSMNDKYLNIDVPEFSSENLHSLLDELLSAYENRGMNLSSSLLPPIEERDLKNRCRWFPGELPREIISLYGWRGGQKKDAWASEHPFWFRDMSFCSIERAEYEYKSMMESYGSYPKNHELLKFSFPIASFNGGWYVLPTNGQPYSSKLTTPIISVFQGIDIYYFSIEQMVKTCIDWVNHDKYRDDYTLPDDIESAIWQKHNPGIFKN